MRTFLPILSFLFGTFFVLFTYLEKHSLFAKFWSLEPRLRPVYVRWRRSFLVLALFFLALAAAHFLFPLSDACALLIVLASLTLSAFFLLWELSRLRRLLSEDKIDKK